jgi:hypothetical protein
MNARGLLLALSLFIWAACLDAALAADRRDCPIARPSDHPFVSPEEYKPFFGNDQFLYGGPAFWTIIFPDWNIHTGQKLPFFRQGYDWMKGKDPRLTVVARRLDGEAPLIWNGWASNAHTDGISFMVTGIDIPAFGLLGGLGPLPREPE